MSQREAFGPNLRRIRLQRGVSLQQLAASTKVSETLWAGLERNDFSRWPNGIFARAYIREYAKAIGIDPEATVDEFCRWFPNGDRRALPQFRGQAEIVGHAELQWQDPVPAAADGDRRATAKTSASAANKGAKKSSGPLSTFVRRVLSRA
ncbi:MAG TPA: helix-turn-helix transcriptional regulator [Vicinamibacterales bacterium]|nr:helix-turn-helix transcriptional regulator [Vicinamibacterales bacterium]